MINLLIGLALTLTSSPTHASNQQFFVKWKSGTHAMTQASFKAQFGVKTIWTSTLVPGLEAVETTQDLSQKKTLKLMSTHSSVHYVEPNFKVRRKLSPMVPIDLDASHDFAPFSPSTLTATPNDPYFSRQWAMTSNFGVRAPGAWEMSQGSSAVIVAVIDTGADANHPDLEGRVLPGYDFINQSPEVGDTHGHGTHVSGIIGARINNGVGIAGINPDVRILPLRAVPDDGDETDLGVVQAFEYAVAHGARIANCSFGKRSSAQAVGDVIAATEKSGLLVVVAAGNESENNNDVPSYPASFRTPNMIVVAATGSSGNLASFSNYGLGQVDIAAPGANIHSSISGGRYAAWSGTSMASPQVAGVAALVLAANPNLSVAQLKQVLFSTVQVKNELRSRVDTSGLVDATQAVKKAKEGL